MRLNNIFKCFIVPSTFSAHLQVFSTREINCFPSKVPFSWRWWENFLSLHWRCFTVKVLKGNKAKFCWMRRDCFLIISYSLHGCLHGKNEAIRVSDCSLSVGKQKDVPAVLSAFICWHSLNASSKRSKKEFKGHRDGVQAGGKFSYYIKGLIIIIRLSKENFEHFPAAIIKIKLSILKMFN